MRGPTVHARQAGKPMHACLIHATAITLTGAPINMTIRGFNLGRKGAVVFRPQDLVDAAAIAAANAAAAAAAEAAGEPLPQRLLHLLRALLVGGWASWMRLEGERCQYSPCSVQLSCAAECAFQQVQNDSAARLPNALIPSALATPVRACRRQAEGCASL